MSMNFLKLKMMSNVFILAIGLSSCASKGSFKNISIENYEPNSENILVDIRTPEEFSQGHLKDAINIDFFDDDFVQNFEKQFDKNDTIYIHCKSGGRSSKAVQLLEGLGYKNLIHLDGGIQQWIKSGKAVEK